MAHFAELNSSNIVIRVLTACNQDILNNGGEQSEQAANYFGTYNSFSDYGVKWVQTSYNNNFRKQFGRIGYFYDSIKDKFISPQPFASWSLDSNNEWQAPVVYPTITTYGNNIEYFIDWDETEKKWIGKDNQNNTFTWIPSSFSWIATGN